MVDFPNAKINLGLNVLGKRKDGYHDIATCFYPIGWKDILEIIPYARTGISFSGIPIPGNADDNLCMKAYKLFKRDFGLPDVSMHLHKIIPHGGGLGGGSSDAASTLDILNRLFNLYLDRELLAYYAAKIGSDCPFFIFNKTKHASGRGEILEDIRVDLAGKHILIVNPGITVPTSLAYRKITPGIPEIPIREILENHPVNDWKKLLVNDFEKPIFEQYPLIGEIKAELYNLGAIYAAMSGSGSSVFGIFDEIPSSSIFQSDWVIWSGPL